MREIKFRAWDNKLKRWLPFDKEHPLKIAEKPLVKDFVKIMQFTGLLDKNGKEIYEGDIVQSAVPHVRFDRKVVEWDESGGYTFFCDGEYGVFPDKVEVIGNIYENPELID